MPEDNTPRPIQPTNASPPPKKRKIPFKWLAGLLVLLVVAVIAGFSGWYYASNQESPDRTVSVIGEATVKSLADEFVFMPQYEFSNPNRQAALESLAAKSEEIVAALKKLGVADKNIQTNANDYKNGILYPSSTPESSSYVLSLVVITSTKELTQKTVDYLVTTSPSGAITPTPTFSTDKRKQLEAQAKAQAEKDARAKAEKSAKNLGYRLGKIKSIEDNYGISGIDSWPTSSELLLRSGDSTSKLSLQPGEQDIRYEVSVVYFIK